MIGIPFYLADPQLARLEREMNDLEDEREIMMYLRHEAGHAFNYAYRLYREPSWRRLFGPFNRPYRDRYRPVPFSREFVRHLPGWYAQKHPDEDFAETFAVWLAPRSNWRRRYRGWPAMRKLRYVERTVRRIADQEPIVRKGDFDVTVDAMNITLGEFYARANEGDARRRVDRHRRRSRADLLSQGPAAHCADARGGHHRAASCHAHRHAHVLDRRPPAARATAAAPHGATRARARSLRHTRMEAEYLVPLTAFGTTLAMHYVTNGSLEHVTH